MVLHPRTWTSCGRLPWIAGPNPLGHYWAAVTEELERGPPREAPTGVDAHSVPLDTLSTILDALGVIVYVSDFATHEVLFVNTYAETAFGRGWAGRRCYDYLQAGQTEPCSFCTNHLLVRDGKAQAPHTWEFQNTTNRRWYLCIDRAIPWSDGHLVRLETAVDITDRKELERFREEYVALISHDLRGPLNAMALTAQLLSRSLVDKKLEQEADQITRIEHTAKRVESMVRDLLDMVSLESPEPAIGRDLVDIAAVARDVREALPEGARARVVVRAPGPTGKVRGDRAQLLRVLENLIANALKHSPPGAPVVVDITLGGKNLIVSVLDEGPGVPPEHRERIFDRFYRVPGTRAEGLGLGLFIVRTIVERHHGHVSVDGSLESGSRFQVTLPVAP